METACFKDLKQAYSDGLLAGLTAMVIFCFYNVLGKAEK